MPRLPLLFVPLLLTALFGAACSRNTPQIKTAGGADVTGAAADMAAPGVPSRRAAAFASLPDRGNLIGYPARRVKRQEQASTWHRADISEEHALRAVVTGEMTVAAPDGQPIRLRYQRHLEHPNGNWTWIGRNEHGEEAIVTFGEKAVFGTISRHGGEELRLATSGGRSWVVEADPGKQHHPDPKRPDFVVPPELAQSFASDQPVTASASMEALTPTAVGTTVDVALGYTTGFASELGGDSQAVTRLQHLVDIANQAYANSQINAQIRLVRTVPVNYPDATDNNDALAKLTGQSGSGSIPVDPAFNALRTARDQYGADLVSLVRRFRTPENKGCGVAWLIGGNQSRIDNSDAPWGYSVVSDDLDRGDLDETDSKTYVCRKETLAHEMGHNMGQAHNSEDSDGTSGAHSYSYGYRETSTTGFYTVMAYRIADSSQKSIRYFANPNVLDASTGRPTGVANVSDNARSMAQTMPVISSFRATRAGAFDLKSCDASRFDFNGDTVADLLWRHQANGENMIWNSSLSGQTRAVTAVPSQLWQVAAVGDFNGDARSDVVWRHATEGWNVLWPSANAQLAQEMTPVTSQIWKIVGVGDFNGDGRSDVFWRHMDGGWNHVWLGGGSGTPMDLSPVPSQLWRVAAVADFNGDGRADVLWRHATDGWNTIWPGGASGVAQDIGPMSSEWSVAATGDFTGDLRADILWRNAASGRNVLWPAGQASQQVELTAVPSSLWEIVAVGDFTADGRNDVVWRHATDGWNVLWPSANSQLARDISPLSTTWQVAGMCRRDTFALQ
jgi:peptidyl-Asp metalloendopeptidase